MLIKKAADIRESEVTPKALYVRRREFIAAAGVTAAAVATGIGLIGSSQTSRRARSAQTKS
jgi:nitrous oxide reductase